MATAFENLIESTRLRYHHSGVARFLQWWVGELSQLMPASLRARMQHARRRVILEVAAGELALSSSEAGMIQQIEVYALDQDAGLQRQQISDLLANRDLQDVARDLLVPDQQVLRKTVNMPIAAENNLRQALAFEMDRQTPFRANDVYFDCRLLDRDKEGGHLKAELLVVRKSLVDDAIAELGPRGLAPSGVDVKLDGAPAGLNLLPPESRYRITNRQSRINAILAVAVAVMLAWVMAQSLWLRDHQIEELQSDIEVAQDNARRVQNIRQQIDDASEAAGFMQKHRAAEVPAVKVLSEVTRLLPDDTYLDRLLISSGNVQMQGKSDNAQQLIELVNASQMFDNASFRGPTRLDSRSGKEIFDLNADFAGHEDVQGTR